MGSGHYLCIEDLKLPEVSHTLANTMLILSSPQSSPCLVSSCATIFRLATSHKYMKGTKVSNICEPGRSTSSVCLVYNDKVRNEDELMNW